MSIVMQKKNVLQGLMPSNKNTLYLARIHCKFTPEPLQHALNNFHFTKLSMLQENEQKKLWV